jgi:streptogramin lyase
MPDGQGIRKPGSGWYADAVWGPAWHGDNLIKIDYRTNRVVAQYPFPIRHGGVYQAHVDRDGMVWVVYTNADAVGKFDPKTARWTTYELPTVGTETHGMQVVTVDGRTQVAVPQWASGKMSKLEFRTREELQALKAEAQRLARAQ